MDKEKVEAARQRLLKERYSNQQGLWQIFGEGDDRNSYLLGTYEGTYGHIVEYALSLKEFFSWGNGGYIKHLVAVKVNNLTAQRRKELVTEKNELEARLKLVNEELSNA